MKKKLKFVFDNIRKDLKQAWLALVILIFYYLITEILFHQFCVLTIVTGFPCPGCGITRALLQVCQGHFITAWNLNPNIYLWIFFGIYACYFRYILGKKIPAGMQIMVTLCIIMTIIYFIRMYLHFPGQPPLVFEEDNLLNRLLPVYSNYITKILS